MKILNKLIQLIQTAIYKEYGMHKLYLMSIFTGLFAAAVCIPFRYSISLVAKYRPYIYGSHNSIFKINSTVITHIILFIIIFLILLFVGWLMKKFPKIQGSGLPQTQELIYGRMLYKSPFTYLIIKFFSGVLTLSSGLSLGREGSSVQMGSLTGWATSSIFKVKESRRKHLISAGAGAGVAAVFTAPLSSSILILESLQKFSIPQTAICTLLSGGTAGILAKIFTPNNIYNNISNSTPQAAEWKLIATFIAMGIFIAILGKLFSNALEWGRTKYKLLDECKWKSKTSTIWFKALFLTTLIVIIGFFFPTMIGGDQTFIVNYAGNTGVANTKITAILLNILFIFTISLFTIISNASRYPGGIFLPMMTIGGLCGKLFYQLACKAEEIVGMQIMGQELDGYFMLIGMSAFFVAVVRTPITGFILISEMTGHYEVFFPSVIVGTVSFYISQLLKTESMNDILYYYTVQETQKEMPEDTYIYVEVLPDSYLCNQTPQTLQLPKDCIAELVNRNEQETIIGEKTVTKKITFPFTDNVRLQPYDELKIKVKSADLEKVYQPIISMSL